MANFPLFNIFLFISSNEKNCQLNKVRYGTQLLEKFIVLIKQKSLIKMDVHG